MNEVEQEVERLCDLLPAYLCERTGLSMAHVTMLLDAQETFWNNQPHVVGHLLVLGFEVNPGEENPEEENPDG